jgi:uncharacterized protein (TIGR02300 family)
MRLSKIIGPIMRSEGAKVAKPEWGTKRTCPECGIRFYDLGKGEPVTCISCAHVWTPEPLLASKQHAARTPKPQPKVIEAAQAKDSKESDAPKGKAKDETDVDADHELVTKVDEKDDDIDLAVVIDKKIDSPKD